MFKGFQERILGQLFRILLILHDAYNQDKYLLTVFIQEVFVESEGGNLAASKIRNLECPNYEICLIDYGCGKFNRKIHIMEQYP